MSSETRGTLRRPTGFSDPAYYEHEVAILGFTYGKHPDFGGYGRGGEGALAIVADERGFQAVPIGWLSLARQPPTGGEK